MSLESIMTSGSVVGYAPVKKLAVFTHFSGMGALPKSKQPKISTLFNLCLISRTVFARESSTKKALGSPSLMMYSISSPFNMKFMGADIAPILARPKRQ